MSVQLKDLLQFLDDCLQPGRFQDYCPNGLQVEGRADVERLVTGVTASQALLEEAIGWGADAVLVHHGYFWKGERPEIVGIKRRRIAALINNDISLIAYHLPLDAHPELGNNARLGQLLELGESRPLLEDDPASVGNVSDLAVPVPAADITARLAQLTRRTPLHIGPEDGLVASVAWCTGAAQGYIESAVAAGADMFITGEVSEPTVHIAREEGIHFVAAGHHATERYGVQALGDYLGENLGLQHRFIDIDNPV